MIDQNMTVHQIKRRRLEIEVAGATLVEDYGKVKLRLLEIELAQAALQTELAELDLLESEFPSWTGKAT